MKTREPTDPGNRGESQAAPMKLCEAMSLLAIHPCLQQALNALHESVVFFRMDGPGSTSGKVFFISRAYVDQSEPTDANLLGQEWQNLIPDGTLEPQQRESLLEAIEDRREYGFRYERRDEAGHPTLFEIKAIPLPTESGDSRCWMWARQEIELAPPDEGMILQGETLRAILSSTLDPIVVINSRGRIMSTSDAIERVLGWKTNELIGKNVNVLIDEPHRTQHDTYIENYRRTGITHILGQTREVPARHKDGHSVPIELSVSKVTTTSGQETFFVGILHDITHRVNEDSEMSRYYENLEALVSQRTKEVESTHAQLRLADRLASLGTLAAGLGHDMYNLLLPLRCRLDMLSASGRSIEDSEHLEAMRDSVNYLQQLADGLRMLALDPNDEDASTKTTNLQSWWEQVGMLLAKGLPRSVNLEVDIPGDLPAAAVAPHRLTQSVLNLIVNAGEAVDEDGVIRIHAHQLPNEEYIQLVVEDNGVGMTGKVMRRALDPFFTTKKRGLGTGMGLSLVHGMIRSIGGSIYLDSEPNRGTKVLLLLPLAKCPEKGDQPPDHQTMNAVVMLEDLRIASMISIILSAAGFEVRANLTEPDGGGWSLLVTDECNLSPQQVEKLIGDTRRRIIILGSTPQLWAQLGVCVVTEPDDFEQLRKAIGEAAVGIKGDLYHDEEKDSNILRG